MVVLTAAKTHNCGMCLMLGSCSPLWVVFSTTCLTAYRSIPTKRPQGNAVEWKRKAPNIVSLFRKPCHGRRRIPVTGHTVHLDASSSNPTYVYAEQIKASLSTGKIPIAALGRFRVNTPVKTPVKVHPPCAVCPPRTDRLVDETNEHT